jgi:thiosulfate dehydrogenase [quinone] large subunit
MTATVTAGRTHARPITVERATPLNYVIGATRLALGWTFLWPFLDKAFGLGHDTVHADGWIHGGSPTAGFLGHATAGPFSTFYQGLAGHAVFDWLFMLGLLGIGVALISGVAVRLAAAAGALLLVLMWSAVLPPANNPFMDEHIIYALTLGVLALSGAGRTLGLAAVWENLPIVKRLPFLR